MHLEGRAIKGKFKVDQNCNLRQKVGEIDPSERNGNNGMTFSKLSSLKYPSNPCILYRPLCLALSTVK